MNYENTFYATTDTINCTNVRAAPTLTEDGHIEEVVIKEDLVMDVTLPVAARWVRGRQKNSQILIDPFNMKLRRKNDDTNNVYFCCGKKDDLDCPVRLTLKKATDEIVHMSGKHTNNSDLVKALVTDKYNNVVKNAVENVTIAPRAAFMDLTNSVLADSSIDNSGLLHIPKPRTMAKTIQRKRKSEQNMPSLPKNWEEMIVPDQYKVTADGEQFLILDAVVPNSTKKVSMSISIITYLCMYVYPGVGLVLSHWSCHSQGC